MGPRSAERGNKAIALVAPDWDQLQWGRALLSAETSETIGILASEIELQWGRALLSAETHETEDAREYLTELQWGRALLSAETPRPS